ncbi:acetyltransferase [Trichoderma gamsii]|uniref:Acetyltransferase n=1 Tax=Trichoderma gamsii TaxID=398673 RepID=A0A2P4ZVZ7_9HYPO|nr:acetyltransferase [Trichoderma gamsii]PON28450.1 acetyltransferase [Trichoderma gamsii]
MMEYKETIKVRTTLPIIPPISTRDEILTPRLLIRAPRLSDVPVLHILRTEHEVMKHSLKGVDKTLEDTVRSLDDFLPPNDTKMYHFLIFERDTGELIGKGGMHSLSSKHFGWPEVGYSFKQAAWGKGYATEFLNGFIENYCSLPRKETELEVDPRTVDIEAGSSTPTIDERLTALADVKNVGSVKVLEKTKFSKFSEWTGIDNRAASMGQEITLAGFLITAPLKESN